MKKLFLSAVAALIGLTASAYDFMVDGVAYNINDNGQSVYVTYTNYYNFNYSGLSEAIIPEKVTYNNKTYNVTGIGDDAFRSSSHSLEKITLPSSIEYIGASAFKQCRLVNLIIPNSVKNIGGSAFAYCRQLKNLVIGNSTQSIRSGAFWECESLESITIPVSLWDVGDNAFFGCGNVQTITLTGCGSWNHDSNQRLYDRLMNELIYPLFHTYGDGIATFNVGSGISEMGSYGIKANTINCYAEVPPTCTPSTFNSSSYQGELHVPFSSIEAYADDEIWQNFINVNNDITEKVALDLTNADLLQWEELQLVATVNPEGSDLLWFSTNVNVATVDDNGVVLATGEGECDIYAALASNKSVYDMCHIIANYPDAIDETIISLDVTQVTIATGETLILKPVFEPAETKIVVSSNNNGVVEILYPYNDSYNSTSVLYAPKTSTQWVEIYGVSEGTAIVTIASANGKGIPATCEVTVRDTVTGVQDINLNRQINPQRFNVLGQPVDNDYKGIVIEGGEKKIVR